MTPQQQDPNGFRHGCTYKQRCDNEATTTVVINGYPRAVCQGCYNVEIRRQNDEQYRAERLRKAEREASA